MKNVWLDVKRIAQLMKLSERAIRFKIEKKELTFRYINACGRGGKKIEILLSSLPEEAQARYAGLEPEIPNVDSLYEYTSKQRGDADNKYWIVELYQKNSMKVDEFIAWYNNEHNSNISSPQLFRWQKKFKEGGVAALVDKRGEHRRGTTAIPDSAWNYFYSLYMTQQKRGAQICYDWTKKEFPDIPSIYAFYRKLKTIPEHAVTYYRDGENALRDILPSMDRDKTDIQSNDIWYSDHHRIDVFTRNEDGSRICRMWLTVFFDARSNKVISYICRNADPDATVIKQTMKKGMEIHGIPREIYFDNGKDYRSKAFSKDFPLSLIHQLGIGSIYATAYHGQAKTVERFFKTFEDRFGKMFPTYTGKDAKNRPEEMRIANERILTVAVPMETFLQCLDNYMVDYNNTPSRGKDMEGKSPDKVYYQNLSVKREIMDRRALTILCGTFERRTVQKNGIAFKNREYQNDGLLPYFKKPVVINYDPDNMDELNVFDEDMRSICVATARVRTPFRHTTEADYKKAQKQKKQVRKLVEKYHPQLEQDTISIIAKNQMTEKNNMEAVYGPAAVEEVKPTFNTEPFETKQFSKDVQLNKSELQDILTNKYAEMRKNQLSENAHGEGPSITQTLMKKYEMERKIGG